MRSISRFVRSTDPRTSRRRGTVFSRVESIIILVLSRTRNVLSSTMHRNSTSSPQNAARMINAVSPALSARYPMVSSPSWSMVGRAWVAA